MPRIDPLDLLKCLGVLLSSNGGIKGPTEVDRVARLMLRFSKKLVSKCIYIHVLKATPTELLDQFLNQNGAYLLVLKWLSEALQTRNTPLLAEMLELLQLLPLSDARLKDPDVTEYIRASLHYNDLGQLIQFIAQEYNDQNCRNLALQFWSRWLSKPTEEFSLSQESILPEDMDLSIYAPDTSSANFGDTLNMSIGDDVGIAINNLSSLDMNNCAPFMENSEFYNMNHFESTPLTTSLDQANHQVFMDSSAGNFTNDAMTNQQSMLDHLQQQTQQLQQSVVQQQALSHPALNAQMELNNSMLPVTTDWTGNNVCPAPVISQRNQEQMPTNDTKPPESGAGLPILKIKIEGRKYVVKNSSDDIEMKEEPKQPAEALTEIKEKDKTQDKEKSKEKEKEKSKEKDKEKSRDKDKKKDRDKEKKSSSKSKDDGKKSSDSKKRDKEKDREKSKSSSSSSSSSKDKSSSSSSKDKSKSSSSSRDEKKDRDREKDKSKAKISSKTEAQLKEAKQAEKNRETLAALKAMSPVVKLAKIPRKKVEENAENLTDATPPQTATSVSDVLDKLASRPKTVKTFNSKFRSTGLVEEPTTVGGKKPAASSPSPLDKKSPVIKRTGSSEGLLPPADKKIKTIDDSAISAAVAAVMKKTAGDVKPAVKLISPRPRPLLQDSSLFMDALEAGSKVSTKKKRPLKDGAEAPAVPIKSQDSPASLSVTSPAPPPTPPLVPATAATASSGSSTEATTGDISPVPLKPMFKFYQDTLETEEAANEEEKSAPSEAKESKEETSGSPRGDKAGEAAESKVETEDGNDSRDSNKTDVCDEEIPSDETKPKGVLVIHSQQRRRPKKSLRWREDHELEMHHFFELDETERVNVNKLQFFEMKQAEREREKQAVKMSKHLSEEAEVEEQPWKPLISIDLPDDRIIYGENSKEKHIQEARESSTLQALYFKGQILPDSPAEPDPEVPLERVSDPTLIPLDDITGNPESVYDHRHIPWPEPKMYGSSSSYQPHQPQLPKHPMGTPHQPYGPPYRGPGAGPAEPYFPERGPAIHGDHPGYGSHPDTHGYGTSDMHPDGPDMHHGPDIGYGGPDGPYGGPPMHHQYQSGRGGNSVRGEDRGAWMAGDGSVYPEHGGPRYDGPPHRDQRLPRDPFREMDFPRDRAMSGGYGDRISGPGPAYMGPPRGMNMDGPRPRFHGPPRGGRGGGPPPGRGGPSNQPCWHFMRGFCRLENRCKFLHPSNFNGASMP